MSRILIVKATVYLYNAEHHFAIKTEYNIMLDEDRDMELA
jgi:hypothetical protein